jgi:hypothetical protein
VAFGAEKQEGKTAPRRGERSETQPLLFALLREGSASSVSLGVVLGGIVR